MIKKVKIFGPRNSGTNYLASLIALNFPGITVMGTFQHGWKHQAPGPDYAREMARINDDTLFVFMLKNTYSWALSLKRNSHTSRREKAAHHKMTLDEFIGCNFNGVETPGRCWSRKAAAYRKFMTIHPAGSIYVCYENLLRRKKHELARIYKAMTGEALSSSTIVDDGSHWINGIQTPIIFDGTKIDYYTQRKWLAEWSRQQLDAYNNTLDLITVRAFKYPVQ
jgi:hypothetical protein